GYSRAWFSLITQTALLGSLRSVAASDLYRAGPLSWKIATGLDEEQPTGLVARVHEELRAEASGPRPERMWALGLCRSVVLVLFLLRQNPVQAVAAELFGVSQATVSRRWTTLLPVVEHVLAARVPDPAEASVSRAVLVDDMLVTTWDWAGQGTALFSGKHRDTGFQSSGRPPSLETSSPSRNRCPAVGTTPTPGGSPPSRRPSRTVRPSVTWDMSAPACSPAGGNHRAVNRPESDKTLNRSVSSLRAAVERAIAHLKDWKVLATRYLSPASPPSSRPSPPSPSAKEAGETHVNNPPGLSKDSDAP
ncbi:transposase family protein, partial [Streptomyces sp. ET3-23]|uniref:helix-turn-helix domain-containing protein n=1 Tax=Streptomyces sp. ET3-23 TaxID=2885643 RepID=UPI001D1087FC